MTKSVIKNKYYKKYDDRRTLTNQFDAEFSQKKLSY